MQKVNSLDIVTSNSRSGTLDVVRGLAIILVMLGHVISTNSRGYENTILFNIIWSLQIPLFMIVSGFVTKYTGTITSLKNLYDFLIKRSLSLLFPWIIWTILIKGLLIERFSFVDLPSYFIWISTNMDSGYWFLFSLWTINIIFGTASYLSSKITLERVKHVITTVLISILLSIVLLLIGIIYGIDMFGIKLTLYYLPFYYIGFIYGSFKNQISEYEWFKKIYQLSFLPSLGMYFIIISSYNLFLLDDSFFHIIVRLLSSLSGCLIVFYSIDILANRHDNKFKNLFILAGRNSLELYLVHGFFIGVIRTEIYPVLSTIEGTILVSINFGIMIVLCVILINIFSVNRVSKFFLFGKR